MSRNDLTYVFFLSLSFLHVHFVREFIHQSFFFAWVELSCWLQVCRQNKRAQHLPIGTSHDARAPHDHGVLGGRQLRSSGSWQREASVERLWRRWSERFYRWREPWRRRGRVLREGLARGWRPWVSRAWGWAWVLSWASSSCHELLQRNNEILNEIKIRWSVDRAQIDDFRFRYSLFSYERFFLTKTFFQANNSSREFSLSCWLPSSKEREISSGRLNSMVCVERNLPALSSRASSTATSRASTSVGKVASMSFNDLALSARLRQTKFITRY